MWIAIKGLFKTILYMIHRRAGKRATNPVKEVVSIRNISYIRIVSIYLVPIGLFPSMLL